MTPQAIRARPINPIEYELIMSQAAAQTRRPGDLNNRHRIRAAILTTGTG
jgi:hypothetical protein